MRNPLGIGGQIAELRTPAIDLVAAERQRQKDIGWTAKNDDSYTEGQLAIAAACYAASASGIPRIFEEAEFGSPDRDVFEYRELWPWDEEWDKRLTHRRIRQLVIAGALILAEIERFQRESEEVKRQRSASGADFGDRA
jgi:hypothetical protein